MVPHFSSPQGGRGMTSRSSTGRLRIVGLGPGPACWITPEAAAILAEATDLVGYAPYLARAWLP